MPDYEVKVPVSATQVRSFVEAERARFKRDLEDILGPRRSRPEAA